MPSPELRGGHEATRVHFAGRRRGGPWPFAARAQQAERLRRIGVLMSFAESDPEGQAFVAAFREGLQKLGWTDGRNIRIDYALGDTRRCGVRQMIGQGTRRAAARTHFFTKHTHHGRATAANSDHSHHFRGSFRSGRQRLCRKLSRPGGNVTGFIQCRTYDCRQMAGVAQTDCAARYQGRLPVQPGNGALCRNLPGPFKAAATSLP